MWAVGPCPNCGRPIPPPKPRQGQPRRFCSDSCRVLSFKLRHARVFTDDELLEELAAGPQDPFATR